MSKNNKQNSAPTSKAVGEPTKSVGLERPPVIAIMGHIDHGKSTLLHYIRNKAMLAKPATEGRPAQALPEIREAGGITQHVGAYEVIHEGKDGVLHKITFLDTPGHEAFAGIRSRGAEVADIAILVVSAEDGVKKQTIEAYKFIKEKKLPTIVAITKTDKPEANIEKARQTLLEHEIYVEGYGGSIPVVAVSAKTGEGVPELLDMMLLVAEVAELKGNPEELAEGFIIETYVDKKKGISSTLIIKNGTIKKGQCILSGKSSSPVRIMEDFKGQPLAEATFSTPIKIIGWDSMPSVGAFFKTYENKKRAEEILSKLANNPKVQVGVNNNQNNSLKVTLPLVIKADFAGSLEAILFEIDKLPKNLIEVQVVHRGIGDITETDIKAASSSTTSETILVLGFNVRIDAQAKQMAERLNIKIATFDIIYKLIEEIQNIVKEKTPKMQVEETAGRAKILRVFSRVKDKQVIGGRVEAGLMVVGANLKIMRRDAEIGQGKIRGLQQQKTKATEIKKDTEFGAMVESKIEILPGDKIEAYVTVEK